MERTFRSNSKRLAKYCLLKFESDNKTAIYACDTLVGKIEIGERCEVSHKGKQWFGVILAMNGMFSKYLMLCLGAEKTGDKNKWNVGGVGLGKCEKDM